MKLNFEFYKKEKNIMHASVQTILLFELKGVNL